MSSKREKPESSSSSSDSSDSENSVKAKRAQKKSKLIDDSASESGSEKSSDDEEEEDDKNENEYEKDGFVVSSDDEDEEDSGAEEESKKKRRRKRLRRGGGLIPDEDDLRLIAEANDERAKEYEKDNNLHENENDDVESEDDMNLDADSDNMDDFIVDDTGGAGRAARKKKKKKMDFLGVSGEQNAEFAELFGYSKEEFETSEFAEEDKEREYDDETKVSKDQLEQKLGEHFEFEEMAKNYMLPLDEEIRRMDIPERMYLKERLLHFKRNKVNRGEWFLRIDPEGNKEEQAKNQRRVQAEWVYTRLKDSYKRLYGPFRGEEKCPTMSDAIEPIQDVLLMFQVEMLEVGFVFTYRSERIGHLSLGDLWQIYDLGYEYCKLVERRDMVVKFINKVIPDDAEDEELSIFVSKPGGGDNNSNSKIPTESNLGDKEASTVTIGEDDMDIDMEMDGRDEDKIKQDSNINGNPQEDVSMAKLPVEEDMEEDYVHRKYSWKEALLRNLEQISADLTAEGLRLHYEYLKFRFGEPVDTTKVPARPNPKQKGNDKNDKNKAIDDLFDEDSENEEGKKDKKDELASDSDSDSDYGAPSKQKKKTELVEESEEAEQPEEQEEKKKLKRRSRLKGSMFELRNNHPEIAKVCNCIGSIPHFAHCLAEGRSRGKPVMVMSDADIQNPGGVISEVLLNDNSSKVFNNSTELVMKTIMGTMAREMFLERRVRQFCTERYRAHGTISTKPTFKGRNVVADEPTHEYYDILELVEKRFSDFTDDVLDWKDHGGNISEPNPYRQQYLKIARAEKEGYLTVEVNIGHMTEKLSMNMVQSFLTEKGFDSYRNFVNDMQNPSSNLSSPSSVFAGWDEFRWGVIERCLRDYLSRWIVKEMKHDLYTVAMEDVARECASTLFKKVTVAPCQTPFQSTPLFKIGQDRERTNVEPPKVWANSPAEMHILGCYLTDDDRDNSGYGVVINQSGQVLDHLKLAGVRQMDELKVQIRKLIDEKAPHMVVINESIGLRARSIMYDLETEAVSRIEKYQSDENHDDDDDENDAIQHNVMRLFVPTVMDTSVASIYSASELGIKEFPEYPVNLRRAISMARYMQDPLTEVCSLWTDMTRGDHLMSGTSNSEILALSLHSLQAEVKPSLLLKELERSLIEAALFVGIDINFAMENQHARTTLQFLPGLGPRKARALIQSIERMGTVATRKRVRNIMKSYEKPTRLPVSKDNYNNNTIAIKPREPAKMGSVYTNAIAFIRASRRVNQGGWIEEDEEAEYIANPLDDTRIHPESTKIAARMCWYAKFENESEMPRIYEDSDDDEERIDGMSTRLVECIKDVMRSSSGKVAAKVSIEADPLWLSKRSAAVYENYLRTGSFALKDSSLNPDFKLSDDKLSKVNIDEISADLKQLLTIKDDYLTFSTDIDTSTTVAWCYEELKFPFAEKRRPFTFPDPNELFDLLTSGGDDIRRGGEVTAKIIGFDCYRECYVLVRLVSGLRGKIPVNQLPTKHRFYSPDNHDSTRKCKELEEFCGEKLKLHIGSDVLCRITDIDKARFTLSLSAMDDMVFYLKDSAFIKPLDPCWRPSKTANAVEKEKQLKKGPSFLPRRITHPNFQNISREDAERQLTEKGLVGEVIFRPSSRGFKMLSLTWMVQLNKFENFAFEESGKKKHDPEIGKELKIKKLKFEDIDDVIANYITPINNFVQDMLRFRKFKAMTYEEIQKVNEAEKTNNPKGIPYYIIPYENHPSAFILAYRPASRTYRVAVGVTPDGYKLESKIFKDGESLIAWFKKNFQTIGRRNTSNSGKRDQYGGKSSYSKNYSSSSGINRQYGGYSGYSGGGRTGSKWGDSTNNQPRYH